MFFMRDNDFFESFSARFFSPLSGFEARFGLSSAWIVCKKGFQSVTHFSFPGGFPQGINHLFHPDPPIPVHIRLFMSIKKEFHAACHHLQGKHGVGRGLCPKTGFALLKKSDSSERVSQFLRLKGVFADVSEMNGFNILKNFGRQFFQVFPRGFGTSDFKHPHIP